jgi:hypothetical protein
VRSAGGYNYPLKTRNMIQDCRNESTELSIITMAGGDVDQEGFKHPEDEKEGKAGEKLFLHHG